MSENDPATERRATAAGEASIIFELPERVRNQIAAGEVVERPASVVKELVENALDAGARSVRVDLEEGGAKLVRIVDDGCGMSAADLRMAFVPHATSKLRDVHDLEHIASLGFRGEALASIGAVSLSTVLSRPEGARTGFRIVNEWGAIGQVVEAGGPKGTTIEVRDLFSRLPARKRFLKRASTELGRCLDILQRLVVAHEGTAFVVTHNGKRVLDVEATMNRRERIHRLFGADLAEALEPVYGEDGSTTLSGFVAPPRFGRTDTTRQMWFLNGRPLRDKVLIRVLKQAYRGLSVENRQPVAFLSLAMDPGKVDVNVSPTKSDVRFSDDRRLFGFLVSSIRRALAKADLATPGDRLLDSARRRGAWTPATGAIPNPHGQSTLPDPGALGRGTGAGSSNAEGTSVGELRVYEVPGRPFDASLAGEADPEREPSATSSGGDAWAARDELAGPYVKVARTYILRAVPDGFEIVDQHALHERITFERLKAQLAAGGVEVQRLLVPELVDVSRSEVQLLGGHVETLAGIGVHVEPFGEGTVAVHGVPALLRRVDATSLVRDLIAVLERIATPPEPAVLLEDVLHSMACRSSVMAGDALKDEDVHALLKQAVEVGGAQTCPHGRPTRVHFSLADLEKAFHRR